MARRFVRVDLSDVARDFRPVAVEPGVPLLDHSQANAKILHKWLGGLVAEPEWEGESVNFYVRDDHGGRLEEVACESASEADLQGPLKADLETLRQRISRVKPETSTERGVHKTLLREFAKLVDDEHRTDRDNYFFRYKDANGRWRLVWCWGYQRVDQQPATTLVCRDPKCALLFVRRAGQSAKCPSCEALQVLVAAKPKPGKRRLLAGLLLLLLGAVLMSGLFNRDQLILTPSRWTGPVGSRVEFTVHKPGLFGFGGQDVTRHAVAVSGDPRIVRIDRSSMAVQASSPGKTEVRFFLGNHTATSTWTVGPAKNPNQVFIEPQTLELGLGTTARLKLIGDYGNGVRVDLTEAAYWAPNHEGIVFSYGGLVEGLAEGTTQVIARYQATPKDKPLEATAKVSVAKLDFPRLEVGMDPLPVPLSRTSKLHVNAISPSGKRYSVLESSRLKLGITPPGIAAVYGASLEGRQTGPGKIEANWNGQLSADMSFDVAAAPGVNMLVVSPEQLDLVVGELADLDIVSPSTAPIRMNSSHPSVAEVTKSNRLVGRSPGTAKVTVIQGHASCEVSVDVTKAKIRSIGVQPRQIVAAVTKTTAVRVIGQTEGDRHVELAPDVVHVEKRPAPKYASLNDKSLELLGVRPTEKGSPETLGTAFESLQAQAPVEVVLPPGMKLPPLREGAPAEVRVLSDQGPRVRFPAGTEFDDFRIEAKYPDGMTEVVTKKATMKLDESLSDSPVAFARGRILAVRPGKTMVHAEYDGVSSTQGLEVEVTAKADLDEIRLRPAPVSILPGETVPLEAVGMKGGKSIGVINHLGNLTWKSDNPQVVDANGPAVTGLKLGQGNVTATLAPITSDPATVRVIDATAEGLVIDRERLQMRVGETHQIGTDLTVSRGGVDLSRQAAVTSSEPRIIRYDPPSHTLQAIAPGVAAVTLSVGGKMATTTVEVLPAAALKGPLVVEPASGLLAPGQALDLRVYMAGSDGGRLDVTNMVEFTSSKPQTAELRGNRVCALGPGSTEVMAKLRDSDQSARARITVNAEEITDLMTDPSRLEMGVGQLAQLRILGRAPSGTLELFPKQPRLKLDVVGTNPKAVDIPASDRFQCVEAKAPGNAEIAITWDHRLNRQVPVAVGSSTVTDLAIEPAAATLHPGQGLVYQVTGVRRGAREVLGPEDGVSLSTTAAEVGKVEGMFVQGNAVGTTEVIAQLGNQQAKAVLSVVAGSGAPEMVTHAPGVRIPIVDDGGYWVDGVYYPGWGGYGIYRHGPRHVTSDVVSPDVLVGRGAPVSVVATGERTARFQDVRPSISDEFVPDFTVNLEVAAAKSQRPLEYRAYASGQSPPEQWTSAQPQEDGQRAVVASPAIRTGPFSTVYDLTVEARDPADGSIEQYPLRFRLAPGVDVQTPAKPQPKEPPAKRSEAEPLGPFDEN